MISKGLMADVRSLEIQTRRIVDNLLAGAYHSVFKGKGIEFSEVREYEFGDDIRDIDWNVTARTGKTYIKKFTEDRELNVMLLIDASNSTIFGKLNNSKYQQMVKVGALLALSAIRNNDRVGLLIFTSDNELYLPPKSGRRHGLRLIRELMAFKPSAKLTDIKSALKHTINSLKKQSIIFLISDFIDDNNFDSELKIMNSKHDVVAIRVLDILEHNWNISGNFHVEDLETRDVTLLRFTKKTMKEYSSIMEARDKKLIKTLRGCSVELIDIISGENLVKPLMEFFKNRISKT